MQGNGHGGDQSLVSAMNATASFKLGSGLHNTTGTVSFESTAVPGHFLIQTGCEFGSQHSLPALAALLS